MDEKLSLQTYTEVLKEFQNIVLREEQCRAERSNHSKFDEHGFDMAGLDPTIIAEQYNSSPLVCFLNTLDSNSVNVILAVLYIGRDTPYEISLRYENTEDEQIEIVNCKSSMTPDKMVTEKLKELDYAGLSQKKSKAISQIYGMALVAHEYLFRAFQLLNL